MKICLINGGNKLKPLIISVSNQKGGVGKTATALNLAVAFASKMRRLHFKDSFHEKVLLVDSDHQSSITRYFFNNILPPEVSLPAIYKEDPIKLCPQIIHNTEIPNLSIVPSTMYLAAEEPLVLSRIGPGDRMKIFLDNNANEYGIVIIDNPPALNVFVNNNLRASDFILVPLTPTAEAFEGVNILHSYIGRMRAINENLDILGYVITLMQERLPIQKEYKKAIAKKFGDKYLGDIHQAASMQKAATKRLPISIYEKSSRSSQEYSEIAQKILHLLKKQLGILDFTEKNME
jgi:chromosome partitioning protein